LRFRETATGETRETKNKTRVLRVRFEGQRNEEEEEEKKKKKKDARSGIRARVLERDCYILLLYSILLLASYYNNNINNNTF
jgi:hypothetical protein